MQRPLLPVFLCAALTVAAYVALVPFLPFKLERGQNQGDTNMMRAEDYLADPDADTVLVGSSLTFRLPPQALGPHIANLAMAGDSPATGLALIAESGARPRLVLVEINLLSRGVNQATVNGLLRFPERQLHNSVRALRTGYDPVNLVERSLQVLLHKKSDDELVPLPDSIRQLIAAQRQSMASAPDPAGLQHNLALISSLVATLEARGVRIGFFEMPIDPSLTDLPGEAVLRQEVLHKFPKDRFCWLTLSLPGGAHTVDGQHLMTTDAALVASQVLDQREKCLRP